MPESITQVQPPLAFIAPDFNPLVYQTARTLLPLWTRWRVKIAEIEVRNPERLVELYRQFQAGESRFMIAFRHPSVNDPFCLLNLLSQAVPAAAKAQGVALKQPIHAHFVYDRGIPIWAGSQVGWFFSQLGGTPIRRGGVDLAGLRSVRHLFANGQFPMMAAPEGATNGHTEIVSPIEPGIAQFGFWCAEDLKKAGRSEQVFIVPLGIRYHYITPPWQAIETLLDQLEADCGLPLYNEANLPQITASIQPEHLLLYRRLLRLGEHLLSLMERFYSKFYHQDLTLSVPLPASRNAQITLRLQALLNAALTVAEQFLGLPAKGSVTDRCRRIEQAGWERIFREDLEPNAPAAERGLADRIAEEADLRLWHMRLVESFVSVTGHYILEKPTANRLAETLLLIWDTVTKLKRQDATARPLLGRQRAELTVGEPIAVSERWPDYQTNRRQASAQLTQDLQMALESLIEEPDESWTHSSDKNSSL